MYTVDKKDLRIYVHPDLDHMDLSHEAFRLCGSLARLAGEAEDGIPRATAAELAKRCGVSKRRAQAALKEAQERDLIEIKVEPGGVRAFHLTGLFGKLRVDVWTDDRLGVVDFCVYGYMAARIEEDGSDRFVLEDGLDRDAA